MNVFWSENDINTRYFESVSDQEAYFDELTRGNFSDLVNFNMGNNIDTAVVYKDKSDRSVSELLSCNYAVVQELDAEGSVVNSRYFFAYPSQDSGRQLRVVLSLDDIQTNYFKYKNQISPCLIKRAHLNRWVDNGDDTISFNGAVDSPLFEAEPIENANKRMSKRTKMNLFPSTSENVINQWLSENVLGWEYVYLTQGKYNVIKEDASSFQTDLRPIDIFPKGNMSDPYLALDNNRGDKISSALVCLCYPIYRKETTTFGASGIRNCIKLKTENNNNVYVGSFAIDEFYNKNNNKSNVYARKFSFFPPFTLKAYHNDYCYVDSNNNLVLTEIVSGQSINDCFCNLQDVDSFIGLYTGKMFDNQNNPLVAVFYKTFQDAKMLLSQEYEIDNQIKFSKSEVVGALKDVKFNPKLLSEQFQELNVVVGGQKFAYDIQKLNKEKIKIGYSEALTPDLTKGYARIYDTSGVYIKECEENLTGIVYTNDNSLMVDNDQLSQMLANNKNFFLQQGLNIGKAVGESVSALFSGRFDKPIETLFGMVDKSLSIGNMRNAPNQVSNANGNVYFNTIISEFSVYIEEYGLLDVEKQVINDLMFQNGFAFNKIDNIANYDNIRHYFNYIEAEVENISAPISNREKERLKQKLKAVRFWNSDNIQYTYENYERGLEDNE